MKKRTRFVSVCLVLVTLLLSACAAPAPTGGSGGDVAAPASDAAAAPAAVIEGLTEVPRNRTLIVAHLTVDQISVLPYQLSHAVVR